MTRRAPYQWLRLWTDMPNDPKWRTIARVTGKSIATVQAVYLQLLVAAPSSDERGRTQANAEDIASALDESVEDICCVLDAMQGRVLDGDRLSGWEKRNPIREDNGAERAKEWRERKRTQTNANERQRRGEESREEKREVHVSVPTEPHPAAAGETPKSSAAEKVYRFYPRKEGHRQALKAIDNAAKRLIRGEEPRERLGAVAAYQLLARQVQAYAASPAGSQEKTWIPHPATWFNQSRYNDDPEMWQALGQAKGEGMFQAGFNPAEQMPNDEVAMLRTRLGLRPLVETPLRPTS